MSDFSNTEKVNLGFKHLFGLQGTSNTDPGSGGKQWYEEKIPSSHIIYPEDIWAEADLVPAATTQVQAQAAATVSGTVVQDRSQGESITLAVNGSDWDITTVSVVPDVGYQVSDVHPNATYVKSVTNVIDNGGGNYTITLNDNSGVSAGSAILHSRIYLTEDLTSNGLSYFCKTIAGNGFSATIENLIPNARFGNGYSIRMFEADGSEIFTTVGAWIPNWQQGLVLFGTGLTPDDLGYATPLYIEAFEYIGEFGGSSGLSAIPGTVNETLRYGGAAWETSDALLNNGTDIVVRNTLTISGAVVVPSGTAPTVSSDPGIDGEIRRDGNFIYLHTGGFWRRTSFMKF